jgi:ABC-type multidrug transport system fused ATPase/permease subunit
VILDEPTSALDPKAESEMYHNFNNIVSKDKTAIFISHRLASTQFCDKIAVFNNGKIVEYGSHNVLMANNKTYAKLYTTQSNYYK